MGWFKEKYGENATPKIPIRLFLDIADKFGEQAAIDTSCDIQEGRVRVETIEKYFYKNKNKRS